MSAGEERRGGDRAATGTETWAGGGAAVRPVPESPAGGATRWWFTALALAAVLAAGVGFLVGRAAPADPAPTRPAVAAPGTPSGFDTRTPGVGPDGEERPFVNIRYHAFDLSPGDGFSGRCGYNAFLFVFGDATSCDWAMSVIDRFRDHPEDLDLGYEPSFVLDGVETYCHYQNPGVVFVGDEESKGAPVWECRADGGRQFVFSGVTFSMIPPMECWREDGTLRADTAMFAGSPAATEIPRTKPDYPTPIEDCAS